MIAKEGIPFILPTAIVAISCWVLAYVTGSIMGVVLAVLSTLVACFFTYFFRDPDRTPPSGENLILSPGDGKVIVHETRTVGDGAQFQLVSIFLSVFNVHVNRIPISGKISHIQHIPGRFHRAFEPEAVTENERTEIIVDSRFGNVRFAQVAGILARRIVCRLQIGDTVARGARFGLIRFGSRIDLFLDPSVKVEVKIGDRVEGGVSVIGRFPQNG